MDLQKVIFLHDSCMINFHFIYQLATADMLSIISCISDDVLE